MRETQTTRQAHRETPPPPGRFGGSGRVEPRTRATVLVTLAALAVALLYGVGLGLSRPRLSAAQRSVEATVGFSPPPGSYSYPIEVELASADQTATILFTTDGSLPTAGESAAYTHPLLLTPATSGVTVVRARRVMRDGSLGPVATASYAVGLDTSLPIISMVVNPPDLWDETRGIYENPLIRGRAAERPAHMTFIDADRQVGFDTGVGIRIHGYQSRAYAKKSLRVYFRSEYGLPRLNYTLFPGATVSSFDTLVLHSGGQDYAHPPLTNWTLIRNQLAAELAFDLGVPATHSRAALLFLNGEPWGIVQIRERIDEDFLADHYGVTRADILESPESALRDVAAGDRAAWDSLMAYVEDHDLADPATYGVVASQVDIRNFINYHILQIYSANTDWPAHNIQLYRPRTPGGRWRWLIWDSDNGFGAEGYSQVDSDMVSHLLDYRHPETNGRDTLLFRKLLDNADFRRLFLSRLADALNTTLAPDRVIAQVDALTGILAPDLSYETNRWPGPTDWRQNVQGLRDFAVARSDYVRRHAVARLGLPGLMDVTVDGAHQGLGEVAINGRLIPADSWHGSYFQGVPVVVTAVPGEGYIFAGWEPSTLIQSPEIALTEGESWTLRPRFERPERGAVAPGDLTIVDVAVDRTDPPQGDWLELLVNRPGGLDLRGWRITDNDTKTATDEGSLIFADSPALANVPYRTRIRLVATETVDNAEMFPEDDVDARDRRLLLYVGNTHIDVRTDPWFDIVEGESIAVLAPGEDPGFADDIGVDFWGSSPAVTPASFGILQDGVTGGR